MSSGASIFARPGRKKLYAKVRDVHGVWQQLSTDFRIGQEAEALAWAEGLARQADRERSLIAGAGFGPWRRQRPRRVRRRRRDVVARRNPHAASEGRVKRTSHIAATSAAITPALDADHRRA